MRKAFQEYLFHAVLILPEGSFKDENPLSQTYIGVMKFLRYFPYR
jgi:hypothetical protein